MSQRLRSCSKTTNFETINCEGYLSCLSKERPHKQRCGQRSSCSRSPPRSNSNSNSKHSLIRRSKSPPSSKLNPGAVKQRNLGSCDRRPSIPSSNYVHHQEVIGDNSALVEVTVRAKTNRKSRSSTIETKHKKRQPWSELLKEQQCNPPESSSFGSFDPLRTLHFLGCELTAALKSKSASGRDGGVSKIVTEMMDAISRIPPEIASAITKGRQNNNINSKRLFTNTAKAANLKLDVHVPEKLHNALNSPRFEHKICQTLIDSSLFNKSENVQKQLEDSIKELDQKCKEMELFCKSLKIDKQKLERQLFSERENARFLRSQMEDMQTERVTCENSTLSQLTKENKTLKKEIQSLQQCVNSQATSLRELKSELETLQKQKEKFENENITLVHNVTISKLEKEKHLAILAVRDRQIKEILTEMNQLQEVVNDELVEFQRNPLLSQLSSQSTVLGNWQQLQNEALFNQPKEMGDNAKVVIPNTNYLVNQLLLSNGNSSFFELPSHDSSSSNYGSSDSKSRNPQGSDIPSQLLSIFHP